MRKRNGIRTKIILQAILLVAFTTFIILFVNLYFFNTHLIKRVETVASDKSKQFRYVLHQQSELAQNNAVFSAALPFVQKAYEAYYID